MEIICEFWCSPLRKEIYSETYIALDTEDLCLPIEIKNSYIDCYGHFWEDVPDNLREMSYDQLKNIADSMGIEVRIIE